MKPSLPAAAADEPLAGGAARMRSRRAGALVVMADGRLAGIIAERDLLRAMAEAWIPASHPSPNRPRRPRSG
jgi:CBS domain-containing protein